jgi:RNA polymerase sigma factor (sigma-70 family)
MSMDAATRDQYNSYWCGAYVEYRQLLVEYARRLTNGRTDEAEDLTQESICRVLKWPKDPGQVSSPLSYFKRVVRNEWRTKWAKEGAHHVESLDQIAGDPARQKDLPTVEPEVLRTLENEGLRKELKAKQGPLTEDEKSLLEALGRWETLEEVAAELGEDPRVTKVRYYALIAKVRYRVKSGNAKAKGTGRP